MRTVIPASERALKKIRKKGGTIRTKDALAQGIQSRTLKTLVEKKELEQISRGVYRLADKEAVSDPDLFTVAARVPKGVICLISALSYHDMTTQIPHKVYIALERKTESPRLDYPPLAVHRFSGKAFHTGIEKHRIDGVEIKVYSPEKTLADCFKFRNKIGMDVVLEALKLYRSRKRLNMKDISYYARICQVENVMRPYLEALV